MNLFERAAERAVFSPSPYIDVECLINEVSASIAMTLETT